MWEIIRNNPQTIIIAVLLHVVIVGLMIVGLDWLKPPVQEIQRVDVVQARIVDGGKLQQQQAAEAAKKEQEREKIEQEKQQEAELRLKQQAEEKRQAEIAREAAAKKKAEAEKKADAEKEAVLEKQRQLALKKKKEAERKKLAEQKRQAAKEQKRKEELQRKAEKERKLKLEQEQKKKAEAERKKAAAAAKRKAEAERKRKATEAREAQMQAEQAVEEGSRIAGAIQRKVQSNWTFFPGAVDRGLRCKVKVKVNSNGGVLTVRILESSGDAAFDRSVETAVYKTDPFPMPESAVLRSLPQFREHEFYFNPSK